MIVKVKNPHTGVLGTVKSYDPVKKVIQLDNGVTAIDKKCEWLYYNETRRKWIPCFK